MLKQFLKIGSVVFGALIAMNCAGMEEGGTSQGDGTQQTEATKQPDARPNADGEQKKKKRHRKSKNKDDDNDAKDTKNIADTSGEANPDADETAKQPTSEDKKKKHHYTSEGTTDQPIVISEEHKQSFRQNLAKFQALAKGDLKQTLNDFLIMKHNGNKTEAEKAVNEIVTQLKEVARANNETFSALTRNMNYKSNKKFTDEEIQRLSKKDSWDHLNHENNKERIHLIAQIIDATGRSASNGIECFKKNGEGLEKFDDEKLLSFIPILVMKNVLPGPKTRFTEYFGKKVAYGGISKDDNADAFDEIMLDFIRQLVERSHFETVLGEEWSNMQFPEFHNPRYRSLNLLNFLIVCNGFDNVYKARAFLTTWQRMEMPFDQQISEFSDKQKTKANEFVGHTPLTLAVKKLAVMILNESNPEDPNAIHVDLNKTIPVYLEIIRYMADHIGDNELISEGSEDDEQRGKQEKSKKIQDAFNAPIPGFRPNKIENDRTVAEGYSDFLVWLVTEAWMKGKVTGKVLKDAFELGHDLQEKGLIAKNVNGGFIDQTRNIISKKEWTDKYLPKPEA